MRNRCSSSYIATTSFSQGSVAKYIAHFQQTGCFLRSGLVVCAVPSGQQAARTTTPPLPRCVYTNTSINCTGFAGSQPFQRVGGAGVGGPPLFALDLEGGDTYGCVYSPAPVALQANGAAASAFSAAFSFSFAVDSFGFGQRGFVFLLSATAGACGFRE